MVLISACLLGYPCKYSGQSNFRPRLLDALEKEILLPICPEMLGGLPVPRPPCEIAGGTAADVFSGRNHACVLDRQGNDCSRAFVEGACTALKIAKNAHIKRAILKKNSPSCGCGTVYDGTFQGKVIPGNGMTAELFLQNGIEVMDEETYQREFEKQTWEEGKK